MTLHLQDTVLVRQCAEQKNMDNTFINARSEDRSLQGAPERKRNPRGNRKGNENFSGKSRSICDCTP